MKQEKIVMNCKPDAVRLHRPYFVDETDAAEMENFEPSPKMYTCACAFLWDEIRNAYFNGDNDLLARDGIAEALEYLTIPENAGTNAAAFDLMFEEWKDGAEKWNADADKAREMPEDKKAFRRLRFWSVFNETAEADADNVKWRRYFLESSACLAALLRTAKKTGDNEFCDKIADAVFEAKKDIEKTRKEQPELIRAEWLNDVFAQTGEALADWLDIAALPDYSRTVEELRKRIADNFGIFPAPYFVNELGRVVLATDTLEKLRYIARDMRRRFDESRPKRPTANGHEAVDRDADDSLLNDNAAQFVTEYKPGISFRFRCNDCEGVTVNIQDLRNADISRVEMLLVKDRYSVDGWCKMPDEWKCPCPSQYKTGSAAQVFFSHLQSKRDVDTDGFVEGNAHLFRLSPVIVKRRRGGDNTGAAGVGAGRGNKKE